MELYNDLKFRFTQANWAIHPELALFDVCLSRHPELVKFVENDVLAGIEDSVFGRKDSPTVEQVLRGAIYKEIKQLTYRDLEDDMLDSRICNAFMLLEENQCFSYSVMQKYISKIKEENIKKIIRTVNQLAINEGIEDLECVGSDTTNIETNIHKPTNNSLVFDCIKTATRLLMLIKKKNKDDEDRLEKQRQDAKKRNYEISNSKKEDMKGLFDPYLEILKLLISESWQAIRSGKYKSKRVDELSTFLPMMIKVYRMSYKFQIELVKVSNENKLYSVYQPHTDILVKGERKVAYGHKGLITRGASNLILDHEVFDGNPSDKHLMQPTIENIIRDYQKVPTSVSNDGGFLTKENIAKSVALGIKNVVFTKVTKFIKNHVESPDIENMLKKWRGTTEAVISNLKRGFGLQRVNWDGFDKFCSKVAWAVLCYNLRVITNRLLE